MNVFSTKRASSSGLQSVTLVDFVDTTGAQHSLSMHSYALAVTLVTVLQFSKGFSIP